MTAKKQQDGILKAVSTLRPGDRSEALYDQWAENYDQDLKEEWGYIAPRIAVDGLETTDIDRDAILIDLGCGTGLVGMELAARGFTTIDGADISDGMLDRARAKGVYRDLTRADLTARTPFADEAYDGALCIGSMGAGHVHAGHVPEMLRIIKPGAPLVIYLNDYAYVGENYEATFRQLEADGIWHIDRIEGSNYMQSLDRPGHLIVARRPG